MDSVASELPPLSFVSAYRSVWKNWKGSREDTGDV